MPVTSIDDLSEGVLFEVDGQQFLSCGRTRADELSVIRLTVRSNGRDHLDVASLKDEIDDGNVRRLDTYRPDEQTVVPTDDLVTVMDLLTDDLDRTLVENGWSVMDVRPPVQRIENRLPDSAYDFRFR